MDTRILNAISGRLSLRTPQRDSLEALAQAIDSTGGALLDPKHDVPLLLETLKNQFPNTLTDFERDFPSLCFALATGVGKTRLMGAFISYLHLAHGIKNFFVLAPNLTIYEKLITDFTPGSRKYVFKGISEFATYPPEIITGDNYEQRGAQVMGDMLSNVRINVFNIAKLNSDVRGGKAPKIKRLSEYLGESYFNYLSNLKDLVLLMDESHRYRADAGVKTLNELNPILGLELTATPQIETSKGAVKFKNVIVDYPLARAMHDGFVKEPAVVTQRNFNPDQHSKEELETIKLKDGIRLHEATKVELLTYAHVNDEKVVKPFMLVIARDTTHATALKEELEYIFEGRYKDKVIQVDSSKSGTEEVEMITKLLAVESVDEPTEIVIHVNMLKEGWDVTNLYTIVPLRAANAKTLVEQSIGRGLRLPYGKRTGVEAVDRLSIVAHDRFQEIVNEANSSDSILRLVKFIQLAPEDDVTTESFQVKSKIAQALSGEKTKGSAGTEFTVGEAPVPLYATEKEQKIAQIAYDVINSYQNKPSKVATSGALLQEAIQKEIIHAVNERMLEPQASLLEDEVKIDLADIINKTTQLVVKNTIDMPRIFVQPKGEVVGTYKPFSLEVAGIKNLKPQDRILLSQSLQTNKQSEIGEGDSGNYEPIKENYILKKLFNKDDIAYDEHSELLFELSKQAVDCLREENSDDKDVENILQNNGELIADYIHAQLNNHYDDGVTEYDVDVRSGFTSLKDCAFTAEQGKPVRNYRDTVTDKSKIKQMLFGYFSRCLYEIQKFDSGAERDFSIILEQYSLKWFKPVKGQFKIYYKKGVEQAEYIPDFIAETDKLVFMIETKGTQFRKADGEWNDEVTEKEKSGKKWCEHASAYLKANGGKEWKYLLIPHDQISENNDLTWFVNRFSK